MHPPCSRGVCGLLFLLLLLSLSTIPPCSSANTNPDPDGDGIVTISDCNATYLCVSDETFYSCPAGYASKTATVTVNEGTTCTEYEQCISFPELCGGECTSIIASEEEENDTPDNKDEDDPLSWCDDDPNYVVWWPDCAERAANAADSGSNSDPDGSDAEEMKDCDGKSIDGSIAGVLDWMGDGSCDKGQFGYNFNCAEFAYDCCDCMNERSCRDSLDDNEHCDSRRRLSVQPPQRVQPPHRRRLGEKKTTACIKCKTGTYCPPPTTESSIAACPSAHYCPTPESKIVCPVDHFCTATTKHECIGGQYCPTGATRGTECPAKSFCAQPHLIETCPKNHYCRGGDVKPSRCSFFQSCPEGTSVPKGTVKWLLGILIFVYIAFQLLQSTWNARKRAILEKKKNELRDVRAQQKVDSLSLLLNANSFKISHNTSETDMEGQIRGFEHLRPDQTKIGFEFDQLSLILNDGMRIIDRVSGRVRAGKMTAIMGPSGCGKTTMLNVLRDKAGYGKIGGTLKVNSEFDSIEPFKRIVGFVPQEDIMHSELTVEEAISFASLLKNKFSVSTKKRMEMVEEVISVLGLEKCRKSVIGDQETRGVSGGQRKRVSIGIEVVGNPSICFLDEPTSGLDSTTSIELISTLKQMTENGMTIVMVIHQPRYEIFNMIDDILFMGANGRPVYLGASHSCLSYFESIGFPCPSQKSPADHFLDVMSGTEQHSTKKDFCTQDLSDWWEEKGGKGVQNAGGGEAEGAMNASNPMRVPLGATGRTVGKPPPLPPAAMRKSKEKKAFEQMEIEGEGGSEKGGKLKQLLAKKKDDVVEWAKKQPVRWREELGFAAKSFVPGLCDRYRTPPSTLYQFVVCAWRTWRQIFSENNWGSFFSDCIMLFAVGGVLGWMFGPGEWKTEANKLPLRNFIASLALALTTCLRALGTFGNERPAFWRERNSGLSSFSYFLGKCFADMIFVVVFPFCFLLMLTSVAQPRGNFGDYYETFFWVAWAATGQGYLVSVVCSPATAKFNGLLSVLMCVMFSGVEPPLSFFNGLAKKMLSLSFARWSCESLTIIEFKQYPAIYGYYTERVLNKHGWDSANEGKCIQGLVVLGIVFRVLSFLSLKLGNRQKG